MSRIRCKWCPQRQLQSRRVASHVCRVAGVYICDPCWRIMFDLPTTNLLAQFVLLSEAR